MCSLPPCIRAGDKQDPLPNLSLSNADRAKAYSAFNACPATFPALYSGTRSCRTRSADAGGMGDVDCRFSLARPLDLVAPAQHTTLKIFASTRKRFLCPRNSPFDSNFPIILSFAPEAKNVQKCMVSGAGGKGSRPDLSSVKRAIKHG
jgi:hypothetical protein